MVCFVNEYYHLSFKDILFTKQPVSDGVNIWLNGNFNVINDRVHYGVISSVADIVGPRTELQMSLAAAKLTSCIHPLQIALCFTT